MRPRRVGVYGGSFNPAHNGHVRAALDFIIRGQLDLLKVCPVYKHPYGKELADFDERLEMCRTAFRHLKNVSVDDTEEFLYRFYDKRGLTAELLESLAPGGRYGTGGTKIVLCVGEDVAKDLPNWEGVERINELLHAGKLEILWTPREVGNVSSTVVRDLAKNGAHQLADLVDPQNLEFVRRLYG